jgi:hypothetical protein
MPDLIAPPAERRLSRRYRLPLGGLCRFALKPEFRCRRATLYDVSARGAGLILPYPLELGALLLLQLRPGRPGQTHVLSARVAHVTPLPCGSWLIGCGLAWPFSEEAVCSLL